MKGIINSALCRSLIAATAFTALVFSLQLKVSPVVAASTEQAKTTAQLKAEKVGYEHAVKISEDISSQNPENSLNLKAVILDKNDTPEGMMAVAKEGLEAAKDQAVAINDFTAFANRLSSDKAYATKLLEAIRKEDSDAVTSVLKETITRSRFTVRNIKSDFHFELHIQFNSYHGSACISSDHSCSGHNVTLG